MDEFKKDLETAYQAGSLAMFVGILNIIEHGGDLNIIKQQVETCREQLIVELGKSELGQAYMAAIFKTIGDVNKEADD